MKTIEVVAAIIYDQGAILATQRGYGNYAGAWEFPGGKIEAGEEPEQALIREIKEELAADIVIDRFITTVEHEYPEYNVVMHCYLAKLTSTYQLLEHSAAMWLTKEHIWSVDWLPSDIAVIDEMLDQGVLN